MNRFSHIPGRRRRTRGVGIVTAIFLLVVLAGLGVALISVFNSQQQGIALDEQGVRAQQAARAGIEWGLYHRLKGDEACKDKETYTVALGGDVLDKFTVRVRCEKRDGPAVAAGEAGLERWIIHATACTPAKDGACPDSWNNPDYVRRVIEVQI
ncbi:agglutinin biogenesis protein MshP [Massilia sp. Mn16-1_5]|uniref:agglutinin biogenesis protein MshP n=1 Tax=Massilia sp. Mn16-1_5 TaxID=2079199 RepID=UPI00109E444A|nr:agglutinin biogenesis protein MshP [Massilia sp. Mn16-1_5]THC46540.1 agglutinin biogenesis protein MshP [Massilia sp. Mn16-1_5]